MRPMPRLEVEDMAVEALVPYARNAKVHTNEQVDQIVRSIEEFGFNDPVAVWHNEAGEPEIVEGHGRVLAAKKLGLKTVPVITLDALTDEQRRAYALVHNKLTMNTGFDFEALEAELGTMVDFDLSEFGFENTPSIDWETVEEIGSENYEKPETCKLRCPVCGSIDEKIHFVKVS